MAKLKSGGQPFSMRFAKGCSCGRRHGHPSSTSGHPYSINYEELNLSRPEVVRRVHDDFSAPARTSSKRTRSAPTRFVSLARDSTTRCARSTWRVKLAKDAAGGKGRTSRRHRPDRPHFRRRERTSSRGCAPPFRAQAEALAEGGRRSRGGRDDAPAARGPAGRGRGARSDRTSVPLVAEVSSIRDFAAGRRHVDPRHGEC